MFLVNMFSVSILLAQQDAQSRLPKPSATTSNTNTVDTFGTINALTGEKSFCETCLDIGKCYTIRVINLNPLLYKLTDSTAISITSFGDDNIFEQLVSGLTKSTAVAAEDPAIIDVSKQDLLIRQGEKSVPEKAALTDNKRFLAFQNDYLAFRHAVRRYNSAQDRIKAFLQFTEPVIYYCYQAGRTQLQIITNLNNDQHIQNYINNKLSGTMLKPTVIAYATSLSEELKNAVEQAKSYFEDIEDSYQYIKNEYTSLPTELVQMFEQATGSVGMIEKSYVVFKPADLASLAVKTAHAYEIVQSPNTFERIVNIYCPDADSILTSIKILRLSEKFEQLPIVDFKMAFEIKGGIRTYTAPAFVMNFFYARDEVYFLDQDSIIRMGDQRNSAFPSLAVMQHFFKQNCKNEKLAATVGLSANLSELTDLKSLRFFGGGSFIWGKKNQLILTGGLTAGWSSGLKSIFEKDQVIDTRLYERAGSELVEKQFQFGGFLAFGIKIFK